VLAYVHKYLSSKALKRSGKAENLILSILSLCALANHAIEIFEILLFLLVLFWLKFFFKWIITQNLCTNEIATEFLKIG